MKRTSLFALLAIAVLSLVSSAPLTASPPVAADQPGLLAPAALPAAFVDQSPQLAALASDISAVNALYKRGLEAQDLAYATSVPGFKRVGAEPSTVLTLTSAPRRPPGHPPARAVPLAEV